MNILFDINHPVDVNFFKNAIKILAKNGHTIKIIYRPRGRLKEIIEYELPEFYPLEFGFHAKSFLGKIFYQLKRDINAIKYFINNKIELVVCFGATSAIASKLLNIPFLAFDDDFEYKIPFYHANIFSTYHIFPNSISFQNHKTHKYNGFKELAYLHPEYLEIDEECLKEYGLTPNSYVFIREVSGVSLNYKGRSSILLDLIKVIHKCGLITVISLEEKNLIQNTPLNSVILDEPVKNIYSIMKNALFAVSSGDTVARETSLLGVPTVYTGGREMAVNRLLVEIGILINSTDQFEIKNLIKSFDLNFKQQLNKKIMHYINSEWENTTEVILSHITRVMDEKKS